MQYQNGNKVKVANRIAKKPKLVRTVTQGEVVKSPSDTTIYAPALNLREVGSQSNNFRQQPMDKLANENFVAQFIESMRMNTDNLCDVSGQAETFTQNATSGDGNEHEPQPGTSRVVPDHAANRRG